MKKILLICLVLVLTFSLTSVCFAATTTSGSIDINTEPPAAGSALYPQTRDIPSENIPGGSASTVTITDETVPKALPKTGGIPAEAFYAVGAILVIGALIILMRKPKTASK